MTSIGYKSEQPIVLFADHSYMTEAAMKTLERVSKVIWLEKQNEDGIIKEVEASKPEIIVSEYCKITGRVMDASRKLRGIMVWGVGYDHVDLDAASSRGICVANTRGSNAESVAEHAIALMLALSRKVCLASNFVKEGEWKGREETGLPSDLSAVDLKSKTLGIIGLGTIGSRVAEVGHALGMSILAYDRYVTMEQAEKRGATLVELTTLLQKSDVVTIHVILTTETRQMIGIRELELMKPTAYLINTSRGGVIDEKALVLALKTRIAGAGLDVFENEPINLENPLMKLKNVILSPHSAGSSKEALEATSMTVCEEVVRMLDGHQPKNLLNGTELKTKALLKS